MSDIPEDGILGYFDHYGYTPYDDNGDVLIEPSFVAANFSKYLGQ